MNSHFRRFAPFAVLSTLLAVGRHAAAEEPGNVDNSRAVKGAVSPMPALGRALWVVGVSMELGGRRLEYTDLVIENLRTYQILATPVVRVLADVYPWAKQSKQVFLPNLGLGLQYAGAPGLSSALASGDPIPTSWNRFEAMLRYRHVLGKGDSAPVVGVAVGYALAQFVIHAQEPLSLSAPSATYHSLRFAANGCLPLGPVALRAELGYRLPVAELELIRRFRDGSAGGVDALLGVSVPVKAGFEARLGASYTRYFYSFFPNPGDPYIAGGALDEYWGVEMGAAHVF